MALNSEAFGPEDHSTPLNLNPAQVVVPDDLSGPAAKSVELLVDEIEARTRLHLPVAHTWPRGLDIPVIAVGTASAIEKFAGPFAKEFAVNPKELPVEGFRIRSKIGNGRAPAILIVGNDARGLLFGVGKLLRSLAMAPNRLELPAPLEVTTAPYMAIRGHQLGYRPKTNSYDAWDLDQWEQYIRDLAVFGCNAIELIPPRSDDAADSPHFPRPQMEMMTGVSKIAENYGLDVWIWYPAMESRYSTPEVIDAAINEWGAVLSKLPRVNALFVPSGDPGNVPPRDLMTMLARQAEQLKRLHPGAQMWISMQSFTQPRFDEMLGILKSQPEWLTGIVHGPQTRVSIAKLRENLPGRYSIRGYPDVTHSMRCEYPVPDWDLAYALTEGREVINPRPMEHTNIFRLYKDTTRGVITYSEGCNDDVNKIIWSRLCWDPDAQPIDTLHEYSRYFIGEQYSDDFAQGLLALERNWRGPLVSNQSVITTLQQFLALERSATPRTLRNWRFQQALYRATYDAYQHNRLIEETAQEKEAMRALAAARQAGAAKAIADAEAILDMADAPTAADPLEAKINELAEALFQSIGMQLSVVKYQAIDVGRGANLDELNVPLNNRIWLKDRFTALRKLNNETERIRGIDEILRWTDPGPGGFYDDLGNPSRQPHLVRGANYDQDPGYLETPTIGFRSVPSWRRSWCTHVDGLYQTPVTMRYNQLDAHAQYKLRVVYAGDNFDVKVRLVAKSAAANIANKEIEIHPFQPKPQPVAPVEYEIPRTATSSGELTLTWHSNPDRGGPGRGCQIAEVWLIKSNDN